MAFVGEFIIAPLFGSPILPTEFKLTPPEVPPIIETVEAKEETIEEKIKRISLEYEIDDLLLYSIVEAESQFQNVCNTKGCRYGIGPAQIVQSTFDERCIGDVNNIDDNLSCAAKLLVNGDYWRWEQSWDKWLPKIDPKLAYKIKIKCSCVQYAQHLGIKIKGNASSFIPNSMPEVGTLALFRYPTAHIALVTSLGGETFTVDESNWKPCIIAKRTVRYDNAALIGFYKP